MKIRPKRFLETYFNSWWLPALVFLGALACFTIITMPHGEPFVILANVLIFAVGLSFLGIPAASVWNLIKKRWAKDVINLLLLSCETCPPVDQIPLARHQTCV
jgi:hypothetical protein